MSSRTPTKKVQAHPPRRSTTHRPSQTLPLNTKTGRHLVRHNLALSTPTISSRSTRHVITQIAPFHLHQLLQVPPPLSPPLRQVHLVKRAFLQSTSPRAATAITLRMLLSRAQTISSRKSPPRLATPDGNLVATTRYPRLEPCALFISTSCADLLTLHVQSPVHHDRTSSPQAQKPQSCLGEARIFVTADSGIFKVVDITGARDAAFIRERIFADVRVQHSCCQDVLGN